jgi:hypothetical protein
MKLRLSRNARWNSCSGQVLTEAAIGLALLSFTWILVIFVTFMATNHLRTAMAARYAAWHRGEGLKEASKDQIRERFFYHDFVRVEYQAGVGMTELSHDLHLRDSSKISQGGAHGAKIATVRFGISGMDDGKARRFPFVLLKGRFPFMPASAPNKNPFLEVSSTCQWEETGNPWNSPSEVVGFIWDKIKEMAENFAGVIADLF